MRNNRKYLLLISSFLINILLLSPAKAIEESKFILQDSIKLLKKAIEKNPDSLELHKRFLDASDLESPLLEKQYQQWTATFKKSPVVPYAYGRALRDSYDFNSEKWLLEAVKRDPSYAAAWYDLSVYADFSGDKKKSDDFLRKAAEAAPLNADYAFYISSRSASSPEEYEKSTLAFVDKFPKSQRAAQALYWLGYRSTDQKVKIKAYERLLKEYPGSEYMWSAAGTSEYFTFLLSTDVTKAVALAKAMKDKSDESQKGMWANSLEYAEKIANIRDLLNQKKGEEATALIQSIPSQRGANSQVIKLLSIEALALNGDLSQPYDSLIRVYAKSPDQIYLTQLNHYATQLGKSPSDIQKDVMVRIQDSSVPATPFALEQYYKEGTLSLEDLKGKVVLLTYWYPGCGPCRAEFPHFENVLKKFDRDKIIYLGINLVRKQDEFVLPFMKESKHTFIPLKEVKERDKGNLDNRGAAPVNFLIDKNGNVAFSNFMINGKNEDTLEKMISLLL